MKKIQISKNAIKEYTIITIGSAVMSLGIAMLVDVFIVPGGASGLSMAFYYIFDGALPIGLLKWIINIPLFIWGLIVLGNQFGWRTFYGFTTTSIFLDMFRGALPGLSFIRIQDTEFIKELATNDFIFLILVASMLMGVGLGLIFKFKGTTGGSDIPAAIFQKKYGIMPGKAIIYIDFFIIIMACFIFHFKGLQLPSSIITLILYALLSLFVTGYIIDTIIAGFDYARQALIITDKTNEVVDAICKELSRGATAIKARGIYRNIDKEIILTVVSIKEIPRLNDIVKKTDPDAFMITNNIHEVMGEGFKRRI
ncbi:MAG: YitT family protein [Bacteroidetes bacterium]|nr:YitT family protein [Bacteroidota bacterium]